MTITVILELDVADESGYTPGRIAETLTQAIENVDKGGIVNVAPWKVNASRASIATPALKRLVRGGTKAPKGLQKLSLNKHTQRRQPHG